MGAAVGTRAEAGQGGERKTELISGDGSFSSTPPTSHPTPVEAREMTGSSPGGGTGGGTSGPRRARGSPAAGAD